MENNKTLSDVDKCLKENKTQQSKVKGGIWMGGSTLDPVVVGRSFCRVENTRT